MIGFGYLCDWEWAEGSDGFHENCWEWADSQSWCKWHYSEGFVHSTHYEMNRAASYSFSSLEN